MLLYPSLLQEKGSDDGHSHSDANLEGTGASSRHRGGRSRNDSGSRPGGGDGSQGAVNRTSRNRDRSAEGGSGLGHRGGGLNVRLLGTVGLGLGHGRDTASRDLAGHAGRLLRVAGGDSDSGKSRRLGVGGSGVGDAGRLAGNHGGESLSDGLDGLVGLGRGSDGSGGLSSGADGHGGLDD